MQIEKLGILALGRIKELEAENALLRERLGEAGPADSFAKVLSGVRKCRAFGAGGGQFGKSTSENPGFASGRSDREEIGWRRGIMHCRADALHVAIGSTRLHRQHISSRFSSRL